MIPPQPQPLRMFECLCCRSDKFHICEEAGKAFISCAYCGIRSDVLIQEITQLVECSRPHSSAAGEKVLDDAISELSDFVQQNAEMAQNSLEDKWGDFDLMILAIKELLRRQREREQG